VIFILVQVGKLLFGLVSLHFQLCPPASESDGKIFTQENVFRRKLPNVDFFPTTGVNLNASYDVVIFDRLHRNEIG
jgi:hypothetical protein